MIKHIGFFLVILTVFSLEVFAQEPDFELKNIDNERVEYSVLKGEKITVLDFWATRCQPCLRAIPEINDLYMSFIDKGVNFSGISVDGPGNQSKFKPFANSMGMEYSIFRDVNSELMNDMNVSSIPTLMIFNSKGEQLYVHEGFSPGDGDILKEKTLEFL